MKRLHRAGHELCVTAQNVREFWNVCTRPAKLRDGFGLSVPAAERHIHFLEKYFAVLADSGLTYSTWKLLVSKYEVSGVQVHDAYLVAAMITHGVEQILTFDAGDFIRYREIEVLDPRQV